MSSTGINFSGLGSGIDTESIINKLVSIEKQRGTKLAEQQKALLKRDTAIKTVTAQLLSVQSAAQSLNRLRSFDGVTSESSDTDAVDVTASTGAQIGDHEVQVTTLATTQKVASKSFSSQTDPLGFSGQIVVNGKALQINATDSLQNLASNINAAQTGVIASIISPNANEYLLTIGSKDSGVQGRISISDTGSGTFVSDTLGVFDSGGGTSLKNAIGTTGAASNRFKDSASSIGTLLGITSPASGTVSIGGQNVAIDLATDSLSGIASKINAAGISGVSASVVATTDPITKVAGQRIEIAGTQSFTDDNNILANLGVLQRSYGAGKQLSQGSDAAFTIDGISASRASNTVTDVISGVTLTLKKEGGAKSTIKIDPDTEGIKTSINTLVSSFNKAVDTYRDLAQFDPQTNTTGPLFADVTAQNLFDSLTGGLTGQVAGVNSSFSQLAQIGITLDQGGHLNVNDETLSAALASNLKDVGRIFRADGVASNPLVRFVTGTNKTKESGAAGYAIEITQVAEQAAITSGTAQTQVLAQNETLTFGGALFGTGTTAPITNGKSISLRAGQSLSDVVSAINGDENVGKVVVASIVGGKLKINSRQYGSTAEIAVVSSIADSGNGDTTGIGNTVQTAKGKDVAGTINGESATGAGQFLTGSQVGANGVSDGKALGLQLQITAASTGSLGKIVFTSGLANFAQHFIDSQTNLIDGSLTGASKSIQDSIKDLQDQATVLDERAKAVEERYRLQFSAMEGAISRIKAASSGLSQLASIPTYSK